MKVLTLHCRGQLSSDDSDWWYYVDDGAAGIFCSPGLPSKALPPLFRQTCSRGSGSTGRNRRARRRCGRGCGAWKQRTKLLRATTNCWRVSATMVNCASSRRLRRVRLLLTHGSRDCRRPSSVFFAL